METKTKKTEKKGDFAVIKTGGKQYVVHEGDVIKIEKLEQDSGKVVFDEVLMTSNDSEVKVGTPHTKSKVEGEIVTVQKDKKIVVIKYKAKSRYFVKNGHRQIKAHVRITSIK